jgi:hypothetical protein
MSTNRRKVRRNHTDFFGLSFTQSNNQRFKIGGKRQCVHRGGTDQTGLTLLSVHIFLVAILCGVEMSGNGCEWTKKEDKPFSKKAMWPESVPTIKPLEYAEIATIARFSLLAN